MQKSFEVEIIADSISPFYLAETKEPPDDKTGEGYRLITYRLTYPRWIHAELLTHRVFSRNSASSRAIPIEKVLDQVKNNPAMPVEWGKNMPGMSAKELFTGYDIFRCEEAWLEARDKAVFAAEELKTLGLHKQIVNRVLEPFCLMTCLVTSCYWSNFFTLRTAKDAQPEIQYLANAMLAEKNASIPKEVEIGGWHIPYYDPALSIDDNLVVATAKAARVSYKNFKESTLEKDRELVQKLADSKHWSPFEHCAQAYEGGNTNFGHFWVQYREIAELNAAFKNNPPEIKI